MSTKRMQQLTKKVSEAVKGTATVSQQIWSYRYSNNETDDVIYYRISYFPNMTDTCESAEFKSYEELVDFIHTLTGATK